MRQAHEIIMDYLDIPFVHRGRTRNGLDCVGLLVMVAREMDMTVFDKRVYGRNPYKDGLEDSLRQNLGEPVIRALEWGDILLLKLREPLFPSHVAMVVPYPHGLGMVHTYGNVGRVVYHRLDRTWKKKIVEVFAWPVKL